MRAELPDSAPAEPSSVLYTSLLQAHLTSLKAIRVSQSAFTLGGAEGLQVEFRAAAPVAGQPATGTLWTFQLHRTVYLVQWRPKNPANPDNPALLQRFRASWAVDPTPPPRPTAAQRQRFRTGRFRYLDPALDRTTVVRTASTQTVVDARSGLRIVYAVQWTDEGYDLTQLSSNAPHAAAQEERVLRVRITGISGEVYSYWALLGEYILTGKMERVK
jgi:hypothetical protein